MSLNTFKPIAIVIFGISVLHMVGCGDPTANVDGIERISLAWNHDIGASGGAWIPNLALTPNGGIMIAASQAEKHPDDSCVWLEKLASDGGLLWSKEFEHITPPSAPLYACMRDGFLAVDGDDNTILLSTIIGENPPYLTADDLFVKMDPAGNTIWATYPDGSAIAHHRPSGVAVDSQRNIVAIGGEWRDEPREMPWVAKYGPDGSMLWTRAQEEFTGSAYAIRIDTNDDILLITEQGNEPKGYSVVVLEKLSSDGQTVWTNTLPLSNFGSCMGFDVDEQGGVVVAMPTPETSYGEKVSLFKYSADGTLAWSQEFASTFSGYSDDKYPMHGRMTHFGMAPDGTIYGQGFAEIDRVCHRIPDCIDGPCCAGDPAALFWKYDPAGSLVWVRFYEALDGEGWSDIEVMIDEDKRLIVGPRHISVDAVEPPR